MAMTLLLRPGSVLWASAALLQPARAGLARRMLSSWSAGAEEEDEEDIAEARKWLKEFTVDSIPKQFYETTYSRSSGPGGQNVNKVSSKATLRFDLHKASNFLPSLIMKRIKTDPQVTRYLNKQGELLLQSDSFRTQMENTQDCLNKLHSAIRGAAALPGETSAEQKDHVAKLQQSDNDRRLKMKKMHSSKKSSRKSKGDY
ncbi:peptidyl-tRNA hydrolase domain-containing protein [Peziza echinospora]|nr:peptidyl-tRNA hydrolase domain-containing protein [Peziza echinospora]